MCSMGARHSPMISLRPATACSTFSRFAVSKNMTASAAATAFSASSEPTSSASPTWTGLPAVRARIRTV